jgi:hypothetical protein
MAGYCVGNMFKFRNQHQRSCSSFGFLLATIQSVIGCFAVLLIQADRLVFVLAARRC